MGEINRTDYNELDLILWDIHTKFVKPEVAFQLYEKRWKYVDVKLLSNNEKNLIEQLTNIYGKGLFMPAY